jgi:hypothetical protein
MSAAASGLSYGDLLDAVKVVAWEVDSRGAAIR